MTQLLKEIQKECRTIFAISIAVFLVLQGISTPVFSSWSGPTLPPPGGNIPVPIYSSFESQTRSGPLTISGNLITQKGLLLYGDYLDFGEDTKTIRRRNNYITIGTAATDFFKFFVAGIYAGRFAIGNPASDTPPTTLYVDGTGQLATTTIDGVFTMGSNANVCHILSYTDTSRTTRCGGLDATNFYVVGVMNTSDVLQNPASPPTSGKIICCKNADS